MLFQLFIDDIPVGHEDILFMDDYALFGDTPEEVYEALQNKLDFIESWPRLKRISFVVHKCFFCLTSFGQNNVSLSLVIPCKNEYTYLGVKFRFPANWLAIVT